MQGQYGPGSRVRSQVVGRRLSRFPYRSGVAWTPSRESSRLPNVLLIQRRWVLLFARLAVVEQCEAIATTFE